MDELSNEEDRQGEGKQDVQEEQAKRVFLIIILLWSGSPEHRRGEETPTRPPPV